MMIAMAKKTVVTLVDDLNGEPADTTVRFGLDSREYELDLTEANATELRNAFGRYISVARKDLRRTSRSGGRREACQGLQRIRPRSGARLGCVERLHRVRSRPHQGGDPGGVPRRGKLSSPATPSQRPGSPMDPGLACIMRGIPELGERRHPAASGPATVRRYEMSVRPRSCGWVARHRSGVGRQQGAFSLLYPSSLLQHRP